MRILTDPDSKRLFFSVLGTVVFYGAAVLTVIMLSSFEMSSFEPGEATISTQRIAPVSITFSRDPLTKVSDFSTSEFSSTVKANVTSAQFASHGAVIEPVDSSASFTGASSDSASEDRFLLWFDSAIRSRLSYPERARKRNTEGKVLMHIVVDVKGNLVQLDLVASSGSSLLDNAALSLARSIFPSPDAPASGYAGNVSIEYRLDR